MDKIVGAYESFFEVWNTSLIPKMMRASKWSAGRSEPLLVGEKVKNDISSSWTIVKVVSLKFRRDGIPKRAEVEYYNPGESFAQKQITDRAVRSLVKLFNVEDSTWKEDIKEVGKVIKAMKEDKTDVNLNKSNQATVENAKKRLKSNSELGSKIGLWLEKKLTCKECSCVSHFNMCSRDPKEIILKKCDLRFKDSYPVPKQTEFVDVLDRSWDTVEKQIKEISEYNYLFPGLMGVLAVMSKFIEIQETHN